MAETAFINGMLDSAFTGTLTMRLYQSGGTEISGGGYSHQTVTLGTAASKKKSTNSNVIFTNLPTGVTIVAWKVLKDGTVIDSGNLTTPFTADLTSNQLSLSYVFDASGL